MKRVYIVTRLTEGIHEPLTRSIEDASIALMTGERMLRATHIVAYDTCSHAKPRQAGEVEIPNRQGCHDEKEQR